MSNSEQLSVVVAGGSVSGLMNALVLIEAGHKVTVLEKTPEHLFKDRGAGLGIRGDVVEFLQRYKPADVPLHSYPIKDTEVYEPDGSCGGIVPIPPNSQATSWSGLVIALKQSLEIIAKNQGSEVSYHYGAEIAGLEESSSDPGKMKVTYKKDGIEAHIDDVALLIGADGSNSAVRRLVGHEVQRAYSGYVFYRGIAPRSSATPEYLPIYDRTTLGSCIHPCNTLAYRIGPDAIMWGSYRPETPADLDDLMTDASGRRYYSTLESGKMRAENVARTRAWAKAKMPPQLYELVERGNTPSIQVITDAEATENQFWGGRVLLVGEAVSQIRPHAFAGTVQSAYHALKVKDLLDGTIDAREWGRNTLAFSNVITRYAKELGERLIFDGKTPHMDKWTMNRVLMGEMGKELVKVKQDLRIK